MIMKKVRQYNFEALEICRNCGGVGYVKPEQGVLERLLDCPDRRVHCPVCEGSGRVKVSRDVTVTVESFR